MACLNWMGADIMLTSSGKLTTPRIGNTYPLRQLQGKIAQKCLCWGLTGSAAGTGMKPWGFLDQCLTAGTVNSLHKYEQGQGIDEKGSGAMNCCLGQVALGWDLELGQRESELAYWEDDAMPGWELVHHPLNVSPALASWSTYQNLQGLSLEIYIPAPYLWRPWFRFQMKPGHDSFITFLLNSHEAYLQARISELPVEAITTIPFLTRPLRQWFHLSQNYQLGTSFFFSISIVNSLHDKMKKSLIASLKWPCNLLLLLLLPFLPHPLLPPSSPPTLILLLLFNFTPNTK